MKKSILLFAGTVLLVGGAFAAFDEQGIRNATVFSEAEMKARDAFVNAASDAERNASIAKCRELIADPAVSAEVKTGLKKALRGFGAPNDKMSYGTVKDASAAMQKVAAAVAGIKKDPKLFSKFAAAPELEVRLAAVEAACKVPVAELVKAYEAADDQVKGAILAKLAARGAAEGAPLAARALESGNEDLAFAGATALRFIGTAAEMPAAVKGIKRGNRIGRESEYAVQDMPDPAATVKLFELAKADQGLFRMIARRADDKQIDLWKTFVKSSDAATRKAAWRALSRQFSDTTLKTAVAWLLEDFTDDEISVASSALKAAAKNADAADVAAIFSPALAKANDAARLVLLPIAGFHPSAALREPVAGFLAAGNQKVRAAAAKALGSWDSYDAAASLMKAYGSETDAEVASAELDSVFKLTTAFKDDLKAEGLKLFKATKPANRTQAAKYLVRSIGFAAFAELEALFADAKYGASAKAAYVAIYEALKAGDAADVSVALKRGNWQIKVSRNQNKARNVFNDDDAHSRWDTGGAQKIGDWFAIGFEKSHFISEVLLDSEESKNDTILGGEVFVSEDGENWTGPVSKFDRSAVNEGLTTVKVLAQGKWVKVVASEVKNGNFWSIHSVGAKTGIGPKELEKIGAVAEGIKK